VTGNGQAGGGTRRVQYVAAELLPLEMRARTSALALVAFR
jgi:hypothetical protein